MVPANRDDFRKEELMTNRTGRTMPWWRTVRGCGSPLFEVACRASGELRAGAPFRAPFQPADCDEDSDWGEEFEPEGLQPSELMA